MLLLMVHSLDLNLLYQVFHMGPFLDPKIALKINSTEDCYLLQEHLDKLIPWSKPWGMSVVYSTFTTGNADALPLAES